jgi:hypothetical protein
LSDGGRVKAGAPAVVVNGGRTFSLASRALMANHHPTQTAGDLAVSIAAELYRAVTGRPPQALRAYQDEDALLVLLRFDPQEMAVDPADGVEPLLQTAFMAMPGMVATAVAARSGVQLVPGNLSVCPERGLAVFAFTETEPASSVSRGARPALRLVG